MVLIDNVPSPNGIALNKSEKVVFVAPPSLLARADGRSRDINPLAAPRPTYQRQAEAGRCPSPFPGTGFVERKDGPIASVPA